MQKILIIRFSSIGDIVLTSPLLRALRKQKPNVEIHYLTKTVFASVLDHNPYIDKLILLNDSITDTIEELKKEKYDYLIDLHKNLRTFRIKKCLNVSASSYEKLNWEKWLLVKFGIDNLPKEHIVQRYFTTLEKIGVKDDGKGLEYYSGLDEAKEISGLPNKLDGNYAAIVVGGTYYTKQVPLEKILDIIQVIKIPVVILGGPGDLSLAQEVVGKAKKKVYSAVGKTNINESAEIIKRSQFVVSGDTGLMHIAAAYQKKIYSVWGNTVPEFGMYPYMPENLDQSVILENKGLKCRPCSKLGFQTCPKEHFDCMMKLDFSEITNQ